MYRNVVDVMSDQRILVDAGSLWRREGQIMILVDDDQHITKMYSDDIFDLEEM